MNHTRKLSHLYHTIGYINVQAFLFNFCGFITQKKKNKTKIGINGPFAAKSAM